ncbi:hypothetical protein ABGS66_13605, partial [Acinetobacter haemolyticus]
GIGGWGNGPASGNGEQNYGIGNGNGDDVGITTPVTAPFNVLGNSFGGTGGGGVSSTNTAPTNTLNHVQDNDTTNNSNNGTGVDGATGNGIGGLLNGVSAGNGDKNYGIGNGNGTDADWTSPIVTPVNVMGNNVSWFGSSDPDQPTNTSTNIASTNTTNIVEDNDTLNNSNSGTGNAGN